MTAPASALQGTPPDFGTISGVLTLLHIDRELFKRIWVPIWYPLEWLPINAAAAQQPATIQVDDNADFVCVGGNYTASGVGAANEGTFTNPAAYSINIKLGSQLSIIGQQGTNTGTTHINNLLENGQNGIRRWPAAMLATRKTTISALLTNLDNTQRNIRATLYGFLVY